MKSEIVTTLLLLTALTGCLGGDDGDGAGVVTVITYDSFVVDEDVLAAFERESGLEVRFLLADDAGAALNLALLNADHPIGDVLLGVDNSFLTLVDDDLLAPHGLSPTGLEAGLEAANRTATLMPYDHGYVTLNYHADWFAAQNLSVPTTLEALTDPAYAGLVAVQNPYLSSPGRGFLFATVDYFRHDGNASYHHGDWWGDMAANGLVITEGWTEAYVNRYEGGYGNADWNAAFSGGAQVVVSYSSSPGIEHYYGNTATQVLEIDRTAFHQVEYAGVLADCGNPGGAQRFLEFLLSPPFQGQLWEQQVMYPVVAGTPLNATWEAAAPIPAQPAELTAAEMAAQGDAWLAEWTRAV